MISGLNIHPTALSGASLNPAGFYTHPSMARASHLTPQLTPQLAHTQAPPTWHTPTVPAKSVTPSNTPGNPLFSLQMLVDNRQNQNQYRNVPGVQSTLDLSATSEMAENYSRIPQDIPISLTARNIDKGSRNGNIISPPIPLNGDTSSDSGISSSVPTPNSLIEPVSLSTKEIITPKISVKNFESNLKGVANLHDKMKESSIDSFVQKVINLPPNVTIERVTTEKKDTEVAKCKDTLSVIAQMPRNVMPVIVNLTSKDKDVVDSPRREPSVESDRKLEDSSVRSPKNVPKRVAKKGVDSLLEKLEGGNKKLGTENIGSVIVTPLDEKDTNSVKSMSPERQKSRSPNREEDVVSPFSNEDSNDNTKQRRKRKLEKPVRLSKDSKTEVEDMELEPTEPTEPRGCEMEVDLVDHSQHPLQMNERVDNRIEQRIENKVEERVTERVEESVDRQRTESLGERVEQSLGEKMEESTEDGVGDKGEENQPIRRRRCSEGPATNPVVNQRVRRKSSDDAADLSKVASPKVAGNANPFNEVESELEKMFAGIVETDETKKLESKLEDESGEKPDGTLKAENVDNIVGSTTGGQSSSLEHVSSSMEAKTTPKKAKKGRVRGGKRKISKSDNIFGPSGDSKDGKKGKMTKGKKQEGSKKNMKKATKVEGLREVTYDSGSNASSIRSRGPVVHVEGPRDSPLSIQVVNVPREDEEEKSKEKRKNLGNGNAGRSKRLSHQNDLDYRGKSLMSLLLSNLIYSVFIPYFLDLDHALII